MTSEVMREVRGELADLKVEKAEFAQRRREEAEYWEKVYVEQFEREWREENDCPAPYESMAPEYDPFEDEEEE